MVIGTSGWTVGLEPRVRALGSELRVESERFYQRVSHIPACLAPCGLEQLEDLIRQLRSENLAEGKKRCEE